MARKASTAKVLIQWSDGWTVSRLEIDAELVGRHFAAHRAEWELLGARSWTLTHVPSGYAVCQGLRSRKAALKLAEAIGRLDWDFRHPRRMPKRTRHEATKLVEQARAAAKRRSA